MGWEFLRGVVEAASDAYEDVTETVQDVTDDAVGAVQGTVTSAAEAIGSASQTTGEVVHRTREVVERAVIDPFEQAGDLVMTSNDDWEQVDRVVRDVVEDVGEAAVAAGEAAWDGAVYAAAVAYEVSEVVNDVQADPGKFIGDGIFYASGGYLWGDFSKASQEREFYEAVEFAGDVAEAAGEAAVAAGEAAWDGAVHGAAVAYEVSEVVNDVQADPGKFIGDGIFYASGGYLWGDFSNASQQREFARAVEFAGDAASAAGEVLSDVTGIGVGVVRPGAVAVSVGDEARDAVGGFLEAVGLGADMVVDVSDQAVELIGTGAFDAIASAGSSGGVARQAVTYVHESAVVGDHDVLSQVEASRAVDRSSVADVAPDDVASADTAADATESQLVEPPPAVDHPEHDDVVPTAVSDFEEDLSDVAATEESFANMWDGIDNS